MRLCKHRKKSSIAFIKCFSKRIRQMKENFVYLLLDWNRFSDYTLWTIIFPTSQSKCASDNTWTNQNSHYKGGNQVEIYGKHQRVLRMKAISALNPCKSCRKIPKSSAKIRRNVPLMFRWGYVNTDKVLYCRWGYVNTEKILLNAILSGAVDKFCESVVPCRFLSDKTTAILEIFMEDTIGNL